MQQATNDVSQMGTEELVEDDLKVRDLPVDLFSPHHGIPQMEPLRLPRACQPRRGYQHAQDGYGEGPRRASDNL